jgi:hypothetical protein
MKTETKTCLNCGNDVQPCEHEDCWHHGVVEPYIHVATDSHYCDASGSDMVAEVNR